MHTLAKKLPDYFFVCVFILIAGFIMRAVNLAYNSPFNDEAIYIVVGKLGILQWDWTTYNASSWMAGIPYFYPSMAALAYVTGGIVGARFLSVIFGVLTIETTFFIAYLVTNADRKFKILSGVIASALVAGSTIGIYVSRLATYDIPSFYFLFLSIALLLYTQQVKTNESKLYFISFISLFLSFAIKIVTGLYIPFIVLAFFVLTKNSPGKHSKFVKYFLYPLITVFAIYLVTHIHHLVTFFSTQSARDKAPAIEVIKEFLIYIKYLIPFAAVGTIGLLIKKQWKLLAILSISTGLILVFHIFTQRVPTLDKHTFVSVVFLALISGIGIVSLLQSFRSTRFLQPFIIGNILGLLALFSLISYQDSLKYNSAWTNANGVLSYLQTSVKPEDTILTEIGSAAILATYDTVKPTSVTTFDWFEYQNLSGEDAYKAALNDGYFTFLVLESENRPKSDINKNLHALIESSLEGQYIKDYNSENFYVYRRTY